MLFAVKIFFIYLFIICFVVSCDGGCKRDKASLTFFFLLLFLFPLVAYRSYSEPLDPLLRVSQSDGGLDSDILYPRTARITRGKT